jgi:uncharacterized membrane protein YhiD involved in acid resistance
VDSILNSLLVSDQNTLGLIDIILALLVPIPLTLLIVWVYRRTQTHSVANATFVQALILLGPIASLMLLVVGNNLARAFGLIGALSIVRFRNAVKSPLEAVFLFWVLAIGIACGVGFFLAAAVAAVIGVLIQLASPYLARHKMQEVLFRVEVDSYERRTGIEGLIKNAPGAKSQLATLSYLDQSIVMVYQIRYRNDQNLTPLVQSVKATPGVLTTRLLNYESVLFA